MTLNVLEGRGPSLLRDPAAGIGATEDGLTGLVAALAAAAAPLPHDAAESLVSLPHDAAESLVSALLVES